MAPRAFLLLALAFAVVLLITSEVAAAKEFAENNDSEISGRGGYNGGGGRGGGGYSKGGGRGGKNDGGRGGHDNDGGRRGHDNGGGRGRYNGGGNKGCRYGCCGGGRYYSRGGCKCCSTFAEATAYKQTQN